MKTTTQTLKRKTAFTFTSSKKQTGDKAFSGDPTGATSTTLVTTWTH